MSYNITVCPRCGEAAYDPDYKRCLNDDCHMAPLSERLHLILLLVTGLLMLVLATSHYWLS